MKPELTKLWINEFDDRKEIRADFSNDRHHAVMISQPHRIDQVADALMALARNIALDPHLAPNALGEGRERGILREASSGEAATSTDGLEGGTKGLK